MVPVRNNFFKIVRQERKVQKPSDKEDQKQILFHMMEKMKSQEKDKGKYDIGRIWPLLQHSESRIGQWKDCSNGRNVNANRDVGVSFYLQTKHIFEMALKKVISI